MENAIARVEIRDFLVFKGEFTADFCPGVNVLIGGNGTGKTSLMKVMYGVCDNSVSGLTCEIPGDGYSRGNSLLDYFYGGSSDLSVLRELGGPSSKVPNDKKCIITYNESTFGYRYPTIEELKKRFHMSEKEIADRSFMWSYYGCYPEEADILNRPYIQSVFIPMDEVLSHAKGFLALNNELKMPFDQTFIDVLSKAELPVTRQITPNAAKLLDKIKAIIDGEVVYESDMFYTVRGSGERIPFSLEASGFRKLGLLWKLLRNGLLEARSILFWDEPEASMNPELIPNLVDMLFELQRGGVQIFVATHSYDVARWFELNKTEENSLKYFNLRRTSSGIEADVAEDYISLPNNIIEGAGEKLYVRIVDVAAQNAGVRL